MLVFPFLTQKQHTTFKESMVNRLSNVINCNRLADKLSQVLCSDIYMLMVMMIVLIVVLVALNMTITTWWQRCWWQWQEWVLNRPNLTGAVLPAHMWPRGFSLSPLLQFFLSFSLNSRLCGPHCGIFVSCLQYSQKNWTMVKFLWRLSFFSKRCDNDVFLTHAIIAIDLIIWISQV